MVGQNSRVFSPYDGVIYEAIRDFAFFFLCVCLNERNISLVAICAVIQSCKDFATKWHLAPALMHFCTKSWSKMVVSWRYADLSIESGGAETIA